MSKAHFGMIGLGTMGRNFLLNIAQHGISGVGYDLDASKRELLLSEGKGMPLDVGSDLSDFLSKLESPRNIMLLVPAGPIVDKVIADLEPLLDADDLVIDGGNSHYTDTDRREAALSAKGIGFMGVGVSGGEEGARHGASIMPGGTRGHYDRVEATFQAVAAKVNGEPCVAYMGSGSAGHFVKMVHNGIEYGMMQLIAESYDLMKQGQAMSSPEIGNVFADWSRRELNSFLIEITSTVLSRTDEETGRPLVDMILDTAGQKGTGKWTSQAAMDMGVPIPTIDSAVTMRQISARKDIRVRMAGTDTNKASASVSLDDLRIGLYLAFIVTYAQGLSLLTAASNDRSYGLNLSEVARIWRGGCIIRSSLLENIREAFTTDPGLENLLLDDNFSFKLEEGISSLRRVVEGFVAAEIPAMCFSATLAYIDAFRTARLPANLIQAQRDHFGAHTYQRVDKEGTFHTDNWEA